MEGVVLPVGLDSFEKLRLNECYYIDKTGLIKVMIRSQFDMMLIIRHRRFGKTLMMSMLADFFDMSKDSREIFAGLAISESRELCQEWMNQWPVLFLTLKNVDGLRFESAYGLFQSTIADICKQHAYLLKGERVDADDKKFFPD